MFSKRPSVAEQYTADDRFRPRSRPRPPSMLTKLIARFDVSSSSSSSSSSSLIQEEPDEERFEDEDENENEP